MSSVFILRLLANSGLGKRSPLAHFVTTRVSVCLSAADTVTQVLQTDYVGCVRGCMCECSDLAAKKQKKNKSTTYNLMLAPNQGAAIFHVCRVALLCR